MSRKILRHKLCNDKMGVGPTFTWSNEAWFRQVGNFCVVLSGFLECRVVSVECWVLSVECWVLSVECALCSEQCVVCNVQCIVCSRLCVVCSGVHISHHLLQHTAFSVQCSVHYSGQPAARSWLAKINGISLGGKSSWKYWENSSQKPPHVWILKVPQNTRTKTRRRKNCAQNMYLGGAVWPGSQWEECACKRPELGNLPTQDPHPASVGYGGHGGHGGHGGQGSHGGHGGQGGHQSHEGCASNGDHGGHGGPQ